MKNYSKVLAIGSQGTETLLHGHVSVQEKIDGSMWRFGVSEKGVFEMGSHRKQIYPEACESMFRPAMEYSLSVANKLAGCHSLYFFCEYLSKPKHNTITYARTPTNGLVLFDVWDNGYFYPDAVSQWAHCLGIDTIPTLREGKVTLDELEALLDTESYLGGDKIEGVVVKNYNEFINFGSTTYPLFCKLVRESFKEKHKVEWKSGKPRLQDIIESFATEARWQKAVQHLAEDGKLQNAPQDIGPLIRAVQEDIDDEEAENIKKALYQFYIQDIKRRATAGLPQWYKAKLADRLREGNLPSDLV